MKIIGRFVTRMQGEDDGLFIGTLFKGNRDAFKPNTVYEIREIFGERVICEIGQGVGAGSDNCVSNMMSDGKNPFHWGTDISHIIDSHCKIMFLTYEECMDHGKRMWAEYNLERE